MRIPLTLLVLALALAPAATRAATVSGTLTPAYGAPLVVQTTQTTLDAHYGTRTESDGSELDAAYAYVADDTLRLFLAGDMQFWVQLEGGITHVQPLYVFVDCAPGGQPALLANNPDLGGNTDLPAMAGLTFDPGFAPDYCFVLSGDLYTLKAYRADLPTGGGGGGAYLGGTSPGAPGTLTGGTNPYAIAATLDDANRAGVTQGCGASSGAGVTTGFEWAIPMAALGNPSGCMRVSAFLVERYQASLLNQVLGPLPPGTCNLGPASGVNFGAISGEQSFSICLDATPAHRATWGALKERYR